MRKRLARLLAWLAGAAALLALAGFGILRTPGFGAIPAGERQARIEASPQWRDGHLRNPQPQWLDLRSALEAAVFADGSVDAIPRQPVAAVATDPATLAEPPVSGLRITWFGHSSTLVEIDGVRVLVDPFWGERASPLGFLGPKPWFAPPIALNALPAIDAVVISHDHFDHLDRATVQAMREWPTRFVVPLGVGAHLQRWGIAADRIRELDWWQSADVGGLNIVATPARHASGRRSSNSNLTLWSGYALIGKAHRVWYSGDSSFHEGLKAIGERLGPFDVSLMDSGQYNEHWTDAHFGPELAVQAHKLVRARRLIPVHWALMSLAPHAWTEPVERTLRAAACQHAQVLVLRPGQPTEPAAVAGSGERWWPRTDWKAAAAAPILSTRDGNADDRYPPAACG